MSDTKATAQTEQQESRVHPGSSNRPPAESQVGEPSFDILHLAELVPVVRKRLGIDETFSDDAILGSLKLISAVTYDRDRAAVAFTSNLGRYLDSKGQQPSANLAAFVAMLPRPRS